MKSPKGHELRRLEGDAEAIHNRGESWRTLADQMHDTAEYLKKIGDSDVNKSKGTDKLGDLAKDSTDDLEKASVRYKGTGKALSTYGLALDAAQTWIHPRIDDIEAAENAYQNALTAQSEAKDGVDHLGGDASDADSTKAHDALDTANGDVTTAQGTRDELWQQFDQRFETWSDAYDQAADDIQNAMDSADNNDGFWEFLDDLLTVLNWVILALVVIALIIGAPITGLLAGIILGLSLLALGITLLKKFTGHGSWGEVFWAAIALVPFAGRFMKEVPALAKVVSEGRGVVATAIRNGLPEVKLLRPSTWATPLRSALAGFSARLALPMPSRLVNPLRNIIFGGDKAGARVLEFIDTMKNSKYASELGPLIRSTEAAMPGNVSKVIQSTFWGITTFTAGTAAVPGLQLSILDFGD